MKIKELLVVHHSHMDIGYTHPQRVVWELHRRYIDEAIDLCEQTADFPEGSRMKWTCEVTNVVLHWLDTASPAQVERMRKLVANGQIGFGAMWGHWTALHQEDMLIESLQPMKRLHEELGAKFTMAIQFDVNGVAWSVADMLLDAGVDQLMMGINIHMGGFPLSRPLIFRWQTPSGREITILSGEHYNTFTRETGLKSSYVSGWEGEHQFTPEMENISVERMAQGLEAYLHRLEGKGWNHDFAVLTATHPIMDDNGPPNPGLPAAIRRWNESGREPFIRMVSPEELSQRLGALDPSKLPLHGGDWTDFWTFGVAASALDVAMSRRAHGALWSARALGTRLPRQAVPTALIDEATNLMHLANEHTWNVFAATAALGVANSGRYEPIPEAEQRLYKSEKCAGALSMARMLRRDAIDALAGNPAQSIQHEGVLLFNPSEVTRRICLQVPKEILMPGACHLVAGTKHRFDVVEDILADTSATTWVGPFEVPPLTIVPVRASTISKPEPEPGLRIDDGLLESRFWHLTFDQKNGVIGSLIHRESGTECCDAEAAWDLFGPLQETIAEQSEKSKKLGDPRYDFFHVSEAEFDHLTHHDVDGWSTDWKAARIGAQGAVRVETSIDAEGVHLHRWLTMPGIKGEMKQSISLLAHEPRVRFVAYFNKSDETNPESLYFAFPFQVANAQAYFDTAGSSIAFDKDQLPGACRDWFTAGSFVAVEGKEGGCLTLACPDAPLFQVGGFNYGRRQTDVSGLNQALVMAWPANNYWNTNFRGSQPGHMRFRYELMWTPKYRPADAARFAAAVARPVVFHPVAKMSGAAQHRLIDGLGGDVTLVTLKSCGEDEVIIGLHNHAGQTVAVMPIFPGRNVTAAIRLNTLEQAAGELPIDTPIDLPANRTTLLRVAFSGANAH